jgi:hypothetical protein
MFDVAAVHLSAIVGQSFAAVLTKIVKYPQQNKLIGQSTNDI